MSIGRYGDEKEIVHTSEKYGDDSLNPSWESESIDVFKLCDGNFNLPLIMSVYHHKSNGKHVLIGEVETSMNQLISEGKVASSGLKLRKKGFHTGVINVDLASIS